MLTVRRKHAVIPRQVHPRLRHQRREARHQIERLEYDVGRAIPIGRLQRVAHLARCRQRQALAGHRRSAHIAAQPFELLTLMRCNVHAGVQGEPARTGGTVRLSFQSLQSRRKRLQRKELLPRPRSDRDAVGDRVAEQIIQRTSLRVCAKPGILEGYTLCLRREYSRYDVIRTFETALAPASMPTLTIPGLAPIECGGFVSVALPETAHACWRRLRFDHARAHLAADSLQVACELLGCTVEVGPPYHPDERPFIERFFGTVATRFSHRLPGTTGSGPDDILRKLKDPQGDLRLVVSPQELRELLAVWVWNYNGTPHGGLGSARTPLEAMTAAIRGRRILIRHLPLSLRGNICLLQSVHPARVRGNVTRGEKPHISFYHVRYTSHRLARSPQLIGKTLRIYYSPDDIRTLRAFLADGTELGELKAGGIWATTPHSLDMRQRIFHAKRLRQLSFGDTGDPVEAYLKFKRGTAKRSRQAASEIAQIKEAIDTAKRKPPAHDAPNAEARPLPLAAGPVKALRLRIPSGFV